MGESIEHINLVKIAKQYIEDNIPQDYCSFLQVDAFDCDRPKIIKSFIPDLYLEFQNLLVIGEAKTIDDYESRHSKQQYDAYLETCLHFSGDSIFVLSIPWQLVPTAKNYFRKKKKELKLNTKIVILNEIGKWSIL